MEKKIEFTINRMILKNLLISLILAIITVYVLELIVMEKPNYGYIYGTNTYYVNTAFNESIFGNSSKLQCAFLALFQDDDMFVVFIIFIIYWVISIINHFVKFKIK
ncbi:hypothetical protein [Flavobacterium sp.]|jgi:hypothetical protein|uniref:hypothetical protein n=1 Tax=Flavobacterium sp. TaxID=239 RepID=UPI0037C1262E